MYASKTCMMVRWYVLILCFIHLAYTSQDAPDALGLYSVFYRSDLYIIRRVRCIGLIFCFCRSGLYITAPVYDARR